MNASIVLIAVFLGGLAAVGYLIYKNIVNPISVFCGIWSLILIAYSFRAYGLYEASEDTISLIVVGVVMFFIGSIVATVVKHRFALSNSTASIIDGARTPNYYILLLFNAISFLFLVGFGITTIQMLLSGQSFYYIHKIYNDEMGTIGASKMYQSIYTWYVWPVMDASIATISLAIQADRDRNPIKKRAIILVLVNLGLFTVITGKRSHLGYIVMYVIAVYLMQGHKKKLKTSTKIYILAGIILIVWAFNAITTSRGSESIIKSLYIYFVGCIPHLSTKLDGMIYHPTGITSIYGLYQAPLMFINSLLRSSYLVRIRLSMNELVAITQQRVLVAPGVSFNAFLTPFYYFYLDGGMLGNIILSFLFGFIASLVYIHHLSHRTYRSMVMYLLVFFTLYMSMVRIQFFQMRFSLSFVYASCLFMKKRVRLYIGGNKFNTKKLY